MTIPRSNTIPAHLQHAWLAVALCLLLATATTIAVAQTAPPVTPQGEPAAKPSLPLPGDASPDKQDPGERKQRTGIDCTRGVSCPIIHHPTEAEREGSPARGSEPAVVPAPQPDPKIEPKR